MRRSLFRNVLTTVATCLASLAVIFVGPFAAAASENCVDPDLSFLAQGETMTMCDGSIGVGTFVAPDLTSLSAGDIKAGVTIGTITGNFSGIPCSSDNQTGCLTTAQHPSAAASSISDPYDFRATNGGFGKLKYCREGYSSTVYDMPTTPVNLGGRGKTFTANATTDLLTVTANTFISAYSPVAVRVSSTGTLPAGLLSGVTYYSVWQSTTTIKLAGSFIDASAGTPVTIDLTDTGTGTHRILPVGDGVARYWDVGDDINSLTSTQGGWFSESYFGAEYLCTASDWRLVAPSADGSSITAGTSTDCDAAGDDCMVQDLMTKEIWTEVNPNGGGTSLRWAESLKFCDDLVFGGYSDWRLPQIKEFAQAYIDGLYSTEFTYPSSGASGTSWMWSSTTQGGGAWDNSSNFVYAFYGSGEFQVGDAANAQNVTRCVRN